MAGVARRRLSLQPSPVLVLWPADYEVRHFRVDLADGQLKFTPGAVEQGSNGFASWLPGLIAAAAITGLGIWLVRRLRRRAAPANTQSSPASPEAS